MDTESTAGAASPVAATGGSGAELVAKLIESELDAEEARKTSVESRGNLVITTSGGLVTLLFALAALVSGQDKYVPPALAVVFILAALVFFVAAAVLGLLTGAVRDYARVKISDVRETVQTEFDTITIADAQRRIAENNLAVLEEARRQTTGKAGLLQLAVIAEVAAVGLLAVVVAIVLLDQLL
jgi:hypothetical protein